MKRHKVDIEYMIELYESGESLKSVSKTLNISESSVRNFLLNNEVQLRVAKMNYNIQVNVEVLKRLYLKDLKSMEYCAKYFGISKSKLQEIMIIEKIERREQKPVNKRVSKINIEELIKLHNSGIGGKRLSEIYEVSESTIYKLIRNHMDLTVN